MKVPYTHWDFDSTTTRLPESAGPGLGRESNRVVVDMEADAGASGVLYALGGIGGGLTLYMDRGELVYEYNMMMIERYVGRSAAPIGAGKHRIVVETSIGKPGGPADVAIRGRRPRGDARRRQADGRGRVLGERDLRRRRRSRLARVVRLFRSRAVRVRRDNRRGDGRSHMTATARERTPQDGRPPTRDGDFRPSTSPTSAAGEDSTPRAPCGAQEGAGEALASRGGKPVKEGWSVMKASRNPGGDGDRHGRRAGVRRTGHGAAPRRPRRRRPSRRRRQLQRQRQPQREPQCERQRQPGTSTGTST